MNTTITKENIRNLLAFLPFFKSDAEKYYVSSKNVFEPYTYTEKVKDFINKLYSESFIIEGFGWPSWQSECLKYVEDQNLIENADIESIQKMLTTFIRKKRYSSGVIAQLIDDDIFVHFLNRLSEIHETI